MECNRIISLFVTLCLLDCYFISYDTGLATAFVISSSSSTACHPKASLTNVSIRRPFLCHGMPSFASFASCLRYYSCVKYPYVQLHMSTIGGGAGGGAPPGGSGGGRRSNGSNNPLDDWLDPKKNLKKNDKYKKRSDARLPISYKKTNSATPPDYEEDGDDEKVNNDNAPSSLQAPIASSSSSATTNMNPISIRDPNKMLQTNPYMQVVNSLSPSELIGRFTTTAHPRVQEAVKATILGLIGSLPKMAFDSKVISTGERLASLMFQLQMTGYMFKNAEYRLALTSSLGIHTEEDERQRKFVLKGATDRVDIYDPEKTKVSGKLKVKYSGIPSSLVRKDGNEDVEEDIAPSATKDSPSSSIEVEVDAEAYMSELRAEVKRLKDDLESRREEREEDLRKDLLMYIRTLPQQQLQELTSTVSPEVLAAMKGLVALVVQNIGNGQIGPNTVTEQSGEAMAQLCMWQLVVGYNLRELEVREEMKSFYLKGKKADIDDGGIIYSDD